jgi:hypothetical protein
MTDCTNSSSYSFYYPIICLSPSLRWEQNDCMSFLADVDGSNWLWPFGSKFSSTGSWRCTNQLLTKYQWLLVPLPFWDTHLSKVECVPGLILCSMGFAGYVTVCVLLYCVSCHCLTLHVLAYMAIFSSVVYFFTSICLKEFASLGFLSRVATWKKGKKAGEANSFRHMEIE